MIVVSDRTALIAISIDASTGSATPTRLAGAREPGAAATRPRITKTTTGTTIVPTAPSGSRMKIFSSIQVSFQRPANMFKAHSTSRHEENATTKTRRHEE